MCDGIRIASSREELLLPNSSKRNLVQRKEMKMHLCGRNGGRKQTRKLNVLQIISDRLEVLKILKPDRLQERIHIADGKEFLVPIQNLNGETQLIVDLFVR